MLVAVGNDNKSIFAGLANNSVAIWDSSTDKLSARFDKIHESGRICSIQKHPLIDNLFLTTTTDGCFSVTDIRNPSAAVIQVGVIDDVLALLLLLLLLCVVRISWGNKKKEQNSKKKVLLFCSFFFQ